MWSIIVRYGEISLKKGLRKKFENILISNLKRVMKEEKISGKLRREWGRIFIDEKDNLDISNILRIANRLSSVFGVVSTSPALVCSSDIDEITYTTLSLKLQSDCRSFALRVRRSGKHNYTSMDVARLVGAKVKEKTNLEVNLTNPDKEIFIEIRDNIAYVFDTVFKGFGGLPVGTQGRVLALDEESAWFALRRGCDVDVTFFPQRILPWACYRKIFKVDFDLESAIKSDYPAVFCSITLKNLKRHIEILKKRRMPVILPFLSEEIYSVEYIHDIINTLTVLRG